MPNTVSVHDFLIYRCDTTSGSCTPTPPAKYTVGPNARSYIDRGPDGNGLDDNTTYFYRISVREEDPCDPAHPLESPLSDTKSAQPCSVTQVLITGNNSKNGGYAPIQTFDLDTRALVRSFVPKGARSGDSDGRGVGVYEDEIYYTELVANESANAIHVAAYDAEGSSADDSRAPLPQPKSGAGMQDLAFHNGVLYVLTGYRVDLYSDPDPSLQVYRIDPADGGFIDDGNPNPVTIDRYNGHPSLTSDGFTVLPNGNFLINDFDGASGTPTYREYWATTDSGPNGHDAGQEKSGGLEVNLNNYGFYNGARGVAFVSDPDLGDSLYFVTEEGIVQTDMDGNLLLFQSVAWGYDIEDIDVVVQH